MKTLKRVASGTSAAVLTLSSLVTMGLTGVAGAVAQSCSWSGTVDLKFSTSGNWMNCGGGVPQNGDNLVFDTTSLSTSPTVNNDMTGLSIGNITFQGTGTNGYTVSGNAITLVGNIVNSEASYAQMSTPIVLAGNIMVSGSAGLSVDGVVSGTGTITKSGTGYLSLDGANTFTGNITVNGGNLQASKTNSFGITANTVTINGGADLYVGDCNGGFTLPNNLTFNGASSTPTGQYPSPKLGTSGICAGGGSDEEYGGSIGSAEYIFSGDITLGSDITYGGYAKTATLTGALSGNYTISLMPKYYGGPLTVSSSNNTSGISNGTYSAPQDVQTLSDSQPTHSVYINDTGIITIDGQRGVTNVAGTLKGTGTVDSLYVYKSGIIAPGHSPGKMTVSNQLSLNNGAIYQVEIKGTAAGDFDQLMVGKTADTDNNNPDVTLGDINGNPTLDVSLYDGYSIKAGDQFKIIDNLSGTNVKGTFDNLPEGATFSGPNGSVFKISYVGGDGNDVVLTVVTAPKTPDTGFAFMSAHPGMTLGLTMLAAGSIFAIARNNRKPAPARVRANSKRR